MNPLELAERIGVKGFLHCNELAKLMELACNREVLEVGAFCGLSAWGMACTAKSVTSIDTFSANTAGQVQCDHLTTLDAYKEATRRFNNVRFHVGSSEQCAGIEGTFDMIFIDAMHDYQSVKDDIARWKGRVRSGGIMAFHDCPHHDFPGVKQAVTEVFGNLENTEMGLSWFSL